MILIAAAAVGIGWWVLGPIGRGEDTSFSLPTIEVDADAESVDFGTVVVRNVPAAVRRRLKDAELSAGEWQARFSLQIGLTVLHDSLPPVAGDYAVLESGIAFRPRFRPVTDLEYTVHVDVGILYGTAGAGTHVVDSTFLFLRVPLEPSTVVAAVYPSTDVLPMNQLRMYIHFSAPMSIGRAYSHIRLVDADTGEDVPDPFTIVEEELWDPDVRRFTLLYDPGRIKRALVPHEEAGLPLRQGRSYRLIVDGGWLDARGAPLVESFAKSFRVVDADRGSPDIATWEMSRPEAATTEALRVRFPESLDHGLLRSTIQVRQTGVPLQGRVAISDEERVWTFIPDEPWSAGDYTLAVDTDLEDLAGNNLRRLFDRNLATDAAGPLHDVEIVERRLRIN